MEERVLFIGGLFLERFAPFLRSKGAEIYLISTRRDDSISAVDHYTYNPSIKPQEIVNYINQNKITGVVSKIDADNEFTYIRDAMVKEIVENAGIPFFGTGLRSATIALDKSIQRECFENYNIPIPIGGVGTSFEQVKEISSTLCYPIILKNPVGAVSKGVYFVANPDELEEVYHSVGSARVVIEEFLSGYEIGLEALVWKGNIQINPSVYLGGTSRENNPHNRVRACPYLNSKMQKKADDLITRIIKLIDCEGIIQVDTVFNTNTEQFFVLEVNCRFNGMSDLTASASNINIFEESVQCVTNLWQQKEVIINSIGFEIPITMSENEIESYIKNNSLVKEVRLTNGKGLIHLSTSDAGLIEKYIHSLPSHTRLFDIRSTLEILRKTMNTLEESRNGEFIGN